ncbi:MAG: triose-phosphate isomerase [Thermoplasmata archaeon]
MLFFINFKAYNESIGKGAVQLIRSIERNLSDYSSIVVVLNPLDSMIETKIQKYVQTAEPLGPGPFTGHIPIGVVKNYDYSGVMLNHSEFRISNDAIGKSVEMASKLGLKTLVCAEGLERIKEIIPFKPDFIAYEPPELIGGNVSVSTAKPEIIGEAVDLLRGKGMKLIVGAGIKNRSDVRISKDLGAEGILVSSGVVKSPEPIKVIVEMMEEVV